jgi:hypothetical protein
MNLRNVIGVTGTLLVLTQATTSAWAQQFVNDHKNSMTQLPKVQPAR